MGTCKTTYTVRSQQQTVIEKEKDLKSCTKRHQAITSLITNPYQSPDAVSWSSFFSFRLFAAFILSHKKIIIKIISLFITFSGHPFCSSFPDRQTDMQTDNWRWYYENLRMQRSCFNQTFGRKNKYNWIWRSDGS